MIRLLFELLLPRRVRRRSERLDRLSFLVGPLKRFVGAPAGSFFWGGLGLGGGYGDFYGFAGGGV